MELTIESALSPGGLVGHTSYLLLVISMLMRRMWLLRILAIASSLVAIAYDLIWLKDPVGVFWESLLVTVNVVQLSITWVLNHRVRLSHEEIDMVDSHLRSLDRIDQRRLLNSGLWISGEKGTVLTQEGNPVTHLTYLASGGADIFSGGHRVAECVPGAFIGEMTVLTGDSATGTAVLSLPSRYWVIDAEVLRALVARHDHIGHALKAGFADNLRDKLVRANAQVSRTRA